MQHSSAKSEAREWEERGSAVQCDWGGAGPANSRLRRVQLFVTEMAEGELDVDSLISRLLEGEFPIVLHLCLPRCSRLTRRRVIRLSFRHEFRGEKKGLAVLLTLAYPGVGMKKQPRLHNTKRGHTFSWTDMNSWLMARRCFHKFHFWVLTLRFVLI